MFSLHDIVMYGADICKIESIEEMSFFSGQPSRQYYILHPLSHPDSTVYVPCDQGERKLRPLLSAGEIDALKSRTDGRALEWIEDRRLRERAYSQLLQQGDPEQILLLIHCLISKRDELTAAGKKLSASDERLLAAAEKTVDEEFCYVLDVSKEDLLDYFA